MRTLECGAGATVETVVGVVVAMVGAVKVATAEEEVEEETRGLEIGKAFYVAFVAVFRFPPMSHVRLGAASRNLMLIPDMPCCS